MLAPPVTHVTTLPLKHDGDCSLLGVTPDRTHLRRGSLRRRRLDCAARAPARRHVRAVDRRSRRHERHLQPLDLPPSIVKPKTGWHTMALNFAGPRHRGLREPERMLDLVRTLGIEEKLALHRASSSSTSSRRCCSASPKATSLPKPSSCARTCISSAAGCGWPSRCRKPGSTTTVSPMITTRR